MDWSLALINGKLAEIFFEKGKKKIDFLGHYFVKRADYKSKKEQSMINEDTKRVRLKYHDGKYTKINGI